MVRSPPLPRSPMKKTCTASGKVRAPSLQALPSAGCLPALPARSWHETHEMVTRRQVWGSRAALGGASETFHSSPIAWVEGVTGDTEGRWLVRARAAVPLRIGAATNFNKRPRWCVPLPSRAHRRRRHAQPAERCMRPPRMHSQASGACTLSPRAADTNRKVHAPPPHKIEQLPPQDMCALSSQDHIMGDSILSSRAAKRGEPAPSVPALLSMGPVRPPPMRS